MENKELMDCLLSGEVIAIIIDKFIDTSKKAIKELGQAFIDKKIPYEEYESKSTEIWGSCYSNIAKAQLNSPKLAEYIQEQVKAEIIKWIEKHSTGFVVGQDIAKVAGNEISNDITYIQVGYLDFNELKEEASK